MTGAEKNSHLVVFGSSAGGIGVLSELGLTLPEGFSTPVVLAQHLDPDQKSRSQEILSRRSRLPAHGGAEEDVVFSNAVFGRTFGDEPGKPAARQRLGRSVPPGEDGEKPPPDDTPQSRAARGESFKIRFTVAQAGGLPRLFEVKSRPIEGGDVGGGCS